MDNLSTVDKFAGPNVSFIERSHCSIILLHVQYVHVVVVYYVHIMYASTLHAQCGDLQHIIYLVGHYHIQ